MSVFVNHTNLASGNNTFARRFGGTSDGINSDAYISGYHFIKFDTLPSQLPTMVNNHPDSDPTSSTAENIQNTLQSACLSVTPPGVTLNKTEFTGLGGVKWAVPTNIDQATSFTIKFLEYSSLPILNIMHAWIRLIRDYRYGASNLSHQGQVSGTNQLGSGYTKPNYSANVYYWTTKPNGYDLEYYCLFTGVFPTKDPQDSFSSDVAANDKVEIDIEFNCDWVWYEPWVKQNCENFRESLVAVSQETVG